jgi:Ca2+-binding RTX toxin-like protein
VATFLGTSGDDSILRESLSAGVGTDPAGLTGTLTGESNLIDGGGGDDTIAAGDGDGDYYGDGDEVHGGAGNDILTGGAAYDHLYGEDGDDVISGGDGAGYLDYIDGGAGDDVIRAAENENNEIYGGAGKDRITGSNFGFDQLYGDAGNDVIRASADPSADFGFNVIDGGAGADTMYGGASEDRFYVDNARDVIIEAGGGGPDVAYVSATRFTLPANVEELQFDDSDRDYVGIGNGQDNVIQAMQGDTRLYGKGGDDYLFGGTGADRVYGGAGDDYVDGGTGRDALFGGSGQDTLHSGEGAARMVGGRGHDLFLFYEVSDSTPTRRDVIAAGDGAIAFEGAGRAGGDLFNIFVDADLTNRAHDTFTFGGTGKGHLSLVDSGADTLLRGNLDDDRSFEFQVLIKDGDVRASAYTADDFLLA